jgi:hypothetical protein
LAFLPVETLLQVNADMPERLFRYVRYERAQAWKRAGWQVISGPVNLKPPPGLEGAGDAVAIVIVEWTRTEPPVDPID